MADGKPAQRETGGCEPGRGSWKSVTFTGTVMARTMAVEEEAEGVVLVVTVMRDDGSEVTETVTFSEYSSVTTLLL